MGRLFFVPVIAALVVTFLLAFSTTTTHALWLSTESTAAEPYTINRSTEPQVYLRNQECYPSYTVDVQTSLITSTEFTTCARKNASGVFTTRSRNESHYSFDGYKAYNLVYSPRLGLHPHSSSPHVLGTQSGYGEQPLYIYRHFESLLKPHRHPFTGRLSFHVKQNSHQRFPDDTTRIQNYSLGISSNGVWVTAQARGSMIMQANTNTGEARFFGDGFSHSTPSPTPYVKTASSSNGRYVAVGSGYHPTLELYDMTTCQTITEDRYDCERINLAEHVNDHYPTYDRTDYIRFRGEHTIELSFRYRSDGDYHQKTILLSPADYTPEHMQYLGMGDSFASGEGAYSYTAGSNTIYNRCHVSTNAYPHRLGRLLGLDSYNSVACSGARLADINEEYPSQPQSEGKDTVIHDEIIYNNFLPGYRGQRSFVENSKPRNITVSIGGNDIGFADIIKACVGTKYDCFDTYEERYQLLENINAKYIELIRTYTALRNQGDPGSSVYVVGYPSIVSEDKDCRVSVGLSHDERIFANQLTRHLNSVIRKAAQVAGVHYIDTFDALDGDRLCEGDERAVHAIVINRGAKVLVLGSRIAHESYHPTAFGHSLLLYRIADASENLSKTQPRPRQDVYTPITSDNSPMLADILGGSAGLPPTGIRRYDNAITPPVFRIGEPIDVVVGGSQSSYQLSPDESYEAWLYSEPLLLKTVVTDENGTINASIPMPDTITAGYHTIKVRGTDLFDQDISVERIVYVADPDELAEEQSILDAEAEARKEEAAANEEEADSSEEGSDEAQDIEDSTDDNETIDDTNDELGEEDANTDTEDRDNESSDNQAEVIQDEAPPTNDDTTDGESTAHDNQTSEALESQPSLPAAPANPNNSLTSREPTIATASQPTNESTQQDSTPIDEESPDSISDAPRVAGTSNVAPTELSDDQASENRSFSRTTFIVAGGVIAAILFTAGLHYTVTRLLRK